MRNLQIPVFPYRLLLLDWDGTLSDSIGSIVGCALEALETAGIAGDPGAIRATVGLDIQESIIRWAPGATANQLNQVQAAYRDRWIHEWHARSDLFPGAAECLERLAAEGYWLAVATGKSRVGLDRDFSTIPETLRKLFVATRTADETQSKPNPAMVHSLLDELGVGASEAVVVGDSTFDLLMARNAGCDGVGVLSGACNEEELVECGAVAVLNGIGDLDRWLLEQGRRTQGL